MIESLVYEYNSLSKIHFIKRARLRNAIYLEVVRECSSYEDFTRKCPIPYTTYDAIGLCMSEGKTVSIEQQNWYMSEKQRLTALEVQRRNESAMRRMESYQHSSYSEPDRISSVPSTEMYHIYGPDGIKTIMKF